ncbi:GtrA family protein [Parabacteroides sp. 52]|uniref:GtrA family protein n=1 Tax=unclassified Parabacteroides TaxID=2649774 RepID=UPI0013D6DE49|nr:MULTISPECIES: GtrA family protein [unclassified Parabacteroides]NDV54597.1 GtrA family protein [Parabacteroides sp. 52]
MKESVRIIRFIIIGSLNALITAVVIWVMMVLLGFNYIWANVAGYIAALINNFFWSKYWVFSSGGGRFWQEVPLFLLAFGCAYAVQFISLLFMVETLGIHANLAQFLGLFVYGAVNFVMNRKVTFRN